MLVANGTRAIQDHGESDFHQRAFKFAVAGARRNGTLQRLTASAIALTATLCALSALAASPQVALKAAEPPPSISSVPVSTPTNEKKPINQPVVLCAYALNGAPTSADQDQTAGSADGKPRLPKECTLATTQGGLYGSGDVVVVVTKESWKLAIAEPTQARATPRLFINGISAGDAKAFLGAEPRQDDTVRLRFHVGADTSTRALWMALYRQNTMTAATPLHASLGWGGPTATTETSEAGPDVHITSVKRQYVAFGSLLGIAVFMLYCLLRTDIFRDSSASNPWSDAATLRRAWMRRRKKLTSSQTTDGAFSVFVRSTTYGANYQPAAHQKYRDAAIAVLASRSQIPFAQVDDAVVGLLLLPGRWTPVRATYSLARIQVGLWLLFIVGAGIFMWLVLGELPTVGTSLVGLLALSAATSAASFAVDGNADPRPFMPSHGLLRDVTSGWDGTQQLHRIQALIVNGLLFCVGIDAVVQNLTYPEFDGSWLALLGVSGIAQAVGKQALETSTNVGSATPQQGTQGGDGVLAVRSGGAGAIGGALPAGRAV